MHLFTQALRRAIPPLYSQAHLLDPFCRAKFVMPDDAVVLWVVEGSTWAKDGGCRHQLLIDYDPNANDVRIRCDGAVGSAWGRESFVTCRHRPLAEYDPARDDVRELIQKGLEVQQPGSAGEALLRLAKLGKKLRMRGPKGWAKNHDAYFAKEV